MFLDFTDPLNHTCADAMKVETCRTKECMQGKEEVEGNGVCATHMHEHRVMRVYMIIIIKINLNKKDRKCLNFS